MSKQRPWEDTFPDIGWNYAMGQPLRSGTLRQRAKSGITFQRQRSPDVRIFEFIRATATTAEKQQIENFHRDLRDGFFIVAIQAYYFDGTADQTGYFAVEFDRDPQIAYVGANSWFIDVRLRESVGKLVGSSILGIDGLFNIWPGANQPQGWGTNTDNTQEQKILGGMGSVLKITTDGLPNPGLVASDNLTDLIFPNKKYIASYRIQKTAGWNVGFTVDLFGTGVDTAGFVIASGSIPVGSFSRFSGDIANNGIGVQIPTDISVRFFGAGTPPAAENLWLDDLMLVEGAVAGDRLFADPRLGYPSFYVDEEDGEIITGSWVVTNSPTAHEERALIHNNTVSGEQFRFHYFGRGFYLIGPRNDNLGIGKCRIDNVELGNFDQYHATPLSWDRLIGKIDIPLGQHEVIFETTNTKNGASSANTILADAIEVIP